MKIVIASDSYKGSATTLEVANYIEKGIRKIYKDADIIKIPVADGGEGTVEALVIATNGKYEEVEVTGPLGSKVLAKYGILNDNIAIIEMAAASGLTLLNKDELNPLMTTTYGTGELIKSAIEKGIRKIYIGLGGSSTNDGGVGMAQALGISFKDKSGKEIGFGGGKLNEIGKIGLSNKHPLLSETEIIGICDVENTLCGINGASRVYGPQKGATKDMIDLLDNNLKYLGEIIKTDLNIDIINLPRSGAAGGLGAGLVAFCNGKLDTGIDKVLDLINIDKYFLDADLVITGEGKIDFQSIYGKLPIGVAKRAKIYDLPVVAIVGSIGHEASQVYSHGIDVVLDIIDKPMEIEEATDNVGELIENAASRLFRIIKLSKRL